MILRQFTVGFKNAFSGLVFLKQKGAKVFQWQDHNVDVIIDLSSTKLSPSVKTVCEIFILSQDFLGNGHHVREINLISSWNLIKTFYLPWNKRHVRNTGARCQVRNVNVRFQVLGYGVQVSGLQVPGCPGARFQHPQNMLVYRHENPSGYVTDLYTKSLYLQLRLESLNFAGALFKSCFLKICRKHPCQSAIWTTASFRSG